MKLIPFLLSICLILTVSCHRDKTFHSINSFRDTQVWTLAKHVQSEDTVRIRKWINSHPAIDIDEEDPKFHKNLLIWSIFNGRYESFEALLRLGANPDFVSSFDGTTPLIYASRYISPTYRSDSRYIATLLKYGAEPNKITIDPQSGLERVALNVAAARSIEYVKILIEIGKADPFIKANNISPVEPAVIQNQLETVEYLITSFGVSLHIPSGTYGGGKTVYDILKIKNYPRDSKFYLLQQKILSSQ